MLEVYEHIRDITDPEHPYSLEQLRVLSEDSVEVDDEKGSVRYTQPEEDLFGAFSQRILKTFAF